MGQNIIPPIKKLELLLRATLMAFAPISVMDFKGRGRVHPVPMARQVFTWLARKHTDYSFPGLIKLTGGRNHSTLVTQYWKAAAELQREPNGPLAKKIEKAEGFYRTALAGEKAPTKPVTNNFPAPAVTPVAGSKNIILDWDTLAVCVGNVFQIQPAQILQPLPSTDTALTNPNLRNVKVVFIQMALTLGASFDEAAIRAGGAWPLNFHLACTPEDMAYCTERLRGVKDLYHLWVQDRLPGPVTPPEPAPAPKPQPVSATQLQPAPATPAKSDLRPRERAVDLLKVRRTM
ncbi:MAG: hypothetical protein EYC62_05765 [Alphaproteobacteria bacterium]|nr:MAG: hypothetical protein EYC62_05765 [Alphaproteobacteria bacterium]